jgi:hypothetical protein
MEMETLEVWFVLATLFMLAVPVAAVALSRGSLSRKGYTNRFAAALPLSIVAMAVPNQYVAGLLLLLVLQVLIVRWTAMRLNALQSFRWYALMWFLWPPVGLALSIVLTEKRHRNDPVLF